jgi:hypothetical protein
VVAGNDKAGGFIFWCQNSLQNPDNLLFQIYAHLHEGEGLSKCQAVAEAGPRIRKQHRRLYRRQNSVHHHETVLLHGLGLLLQSLLQPIIECWGFSLDDRGHGSSAARSWPPPAIPPTAISSIGVLRPVLFKWPHLQSLLQP